MGLYINQKGKWLGGQPNAKKGEMVVHTVRKTWFDIRYYYANMIDYFRVLMGVVALAVIIQAPEYKYTIASLIFGNVLLDWVDGPVARAYNQSSVMGCGWDWFGDILAQYDLAIWCVSEKSPIALFVVLFTAVEIGCGLFDFAISATSVYPEQHDEGKHPFFIVERWLTPGGTYNKLGTTCWLVNTLYPIAVLLDWNTHVIYTMAILAYLYAWHEVCQFIFIVECWTETTASFGAGIQFTRKCNDEERAALSETFNTCQRLMNITEVPVEGGPREIHWTNLYCDSQFHAQKDNIPSFPAMEKFVQNIIAENYEVDDPRHILSYGYIIGPKNGTTNQIWHHDYAAGVSNIMIPMTQDTTNNATQFVRLPGGPAKSFQDDENTPYRVDQNQSYPPPHEMFAREETSHMEVTQVISEPFSILKLMPNVIHRGIANREDYDRVLFFLSTSKASRIPDIGETTYSKVDERGNVLPNPEPAATIQVTLTVKAAAGAQVKSRGNKSKK